MSALHDFSHGFSPLCRVFFGEKLVLHKTLWDDPIPIRRAETPGTPRHWPWGSRTFRRCCRCSSSRRWGAKPRSRLERVAGSTEVPKMPESSGINGFNGILWWFYGGLMGSNGIIRDWLMFHFGYIGHHLIVAIKKTIYLMESNGWVMWNMGTFNDPWGNHDSIDDVFFSPHVPGWFQVFNCSMCLILFGGCYMVIWWLFDDHLMSDNTLMIIYDNEWDSMILKWW